jgi:hypothetical protein
MFGMVGAGGAFGAFCASGMFHRPLVVLRLPTMSTCQFLEILLFYLVERAMQLWSHSCSMEMREPDLMLLKMCPTWACGESYGARGTTARLAASMLSCLATWTDGPVVVW